ncbi:MAG: hypothetical protein AAGI51_06185, partial [Pseudomonadota bacterium]
MIFKPSVMAAAAALLLSAGAAQAVTIQNAGFELQGGGDFRTAAGWSQVQNDGREDANMPWDAPGPSEGAWLMRLNGGRTAKPAVSQLVGGFDLGRSYKLSVDVGNYAARFGSDTALNFGIEVDGANGTIASAYFSKQDLGIAGPNRPMSTAMLVFDAAETDLTIRFLGQIVDDSSFVIDNVRISAIPVP